MLKRETAQVRLGGVMDKLSPVCQKWSSLPKLFMFKYSSALEPGGR